MISIATAAGFFGFNALQNDNGIKTLTEKTSETTQQSSELKPQENTIPSTTNQTTLKETPAKSYATLAEFNADKSVYDANKKIYFFHAPWCPICKAIDTDIMSDTSQIPSGTTFIKTDFDSNIELRQKYGVTYQYTFVQVDNDGNEVKQWNTTTLDKAISGIQ